MSAERKGKGQSMHVLIVGPSEVTRIGLRDIISRAGGIVVGDARSPSSALSAPPETSPSIILIEDWDRDAVGDLSSRYPDARIVVFSLYCSGTLAQGMYSTGVTGVISKLAPADVVVSALRTVQQGKRVLAGPWMTTTDRTISIALTRRETEVAEMLLAGSGTKHVAATLGITQKSVRTYVSRLHAKFATRRREELLCALLGHKEVRVAQPRQVAVPAPVLGYSRAIS